MMLQEFTDRTGFIPKESEWETINEAYMLSSLDKNQFCRLWVKLNAGRVKEDREKREYEKRLEKQMLRVKFQVRYRPTSDWYYEIRENLKCYLFESEKPLFLGKVLSLKKGQQMIFQCASGFQICAFCV